jgi:integration host factor subunit alpha
MQTLTKDILIERIHAKGYPVKDSRDMIETIIEVIKSRLEAGDEVKISGFGKWMVREKSTRVGRNPQSGETMEIAARRVVTFHPSDILRNQIDKKEG